MARDWGNDPRLAAKQRLRELGPIIQAHADTNGVPSPDEYDYGGDDPDLQQHDAACTAAFRAFPPSPDELRKALEEQLGIMIRHPETDKELVILSYEQLLILRSTLTS